MFCSVCGAKNEMIARFCRGCGVSVALVPAALPSVGARRGARPRAVALAALGAVSFIAASSGRAWPG